MKPLLLLSLVFILSCCYDKKTEKIEDRDVNNFAASVFSSQENFSVFGKVELQAILKKSEFNKVKISGISPSLFISDYLNQLNPKKPIYYALEGPFDASYFSEESKTSKYLFAEIKSNTSFLEFMQKQGFELKKSEKGQISYFNNSNLFFAVQGNILISIIDAKENEAIEQAKKLFKSSSKKQKSKMDAFLKTKGDVVFCTNMEALYSSYNKKLKDIDKNIQAKIQKSFKESSVNTSVFFEKGQIRLKFKTSFSETLKKELDFLQPIQKNSIINKVASGKPNAGIDLQLNFKKLSKFLNTYFNNFNSVIRDSGADMLLEDMSITDIFETIFNGNISCFVYPEKNENGAITPNFPQFNLYMGLSKNGDEEIKKLGLLTLINGFSINKNSILLCSDEKNHPKNGILTLRKEFEKFGEKPISLFVDVEEENTEEFNEMSYGIIQEIKNAYLELDINGGEIIIQTKHTNENILKSSVNFGLRILSDNLLSKLF